MKFLSDNDALTLQKLVRWVRNFRVDGANSFQNSSDGCVIDVTRPRPSSIPPSPILMRFAKIVTAWLPATNYVQVSPCSDDTGSDASADPTKYIWIAVCSPYNLPAPAFGPGIGDVISYCPVGGITEMATPPGGGSTEPIVGVCWPPPYFPARNVKQYQLMSSNSSTTPNFTNDWARAHDTPP